MLIDSSGYSVSGTFRAEAWSNSIYVMCMRLENLCNMCGPLNKPQHDIFTSLQGYEVTIIFGSFSYENIEGFLNMTGEKYLNNVALAINNFKFW